MAGAPRWSLCALAAVSALLGILASRPQWATRDGLDVWGPLEAARQAERRRQELLVAEGGVGRVDERARCRHGLAAAVCQRRMGLLEAAARFRRLNEEDGASRNLRLLYPDDSEEERCCRQVILWVLHRPAGVPPEEADRRAAELEQELADYRSSRKQ
jgi:hypothetical protein